MADPKPHPDYSIHKFSLLGNPRLGPDEDRISISPDHMAAYNAKFHPDIWNISDNPAPKDRRK